MVAVLLPLPTTVSVTDVRVEESGAVLGQPGIDDSEVVTVLLQNPQGTRPGPTVLSLSLSVTFL